MISTVPPILIITSFWLLLKLVNQRHGTLVLSGAESIRRRQNMWIVVQTRVNGIARMAFKNVFLVEVAVSLASRLIVPRVRRGGAVHPTLFVDMMEVAIADLAPVVLALVL